MAEIPTAPSCH